MVVQILLIKNLFATLGKHVMLVVGNLLLAGGMVSTRADDISEGFRHTRGLFRLNAVPNAQLFAKCAQTVSDPASILVCGW